MANKSDNQFSEGEGKDPLTSSLENLITQEVPSGLDRRAFLMRSALVGAMSVITGRRVPAQQNKEFPASEEPKGVAGGPSNVPLSPNLYVVKEEKGPVLTVLDEFYKVGPGPSSSHTSRRKASHRSLLQRNRRSLCCGASPE
jgi:L-serine dehydratase